MKRIIGLCLACVLAAAFLTACGSGREIKESTGASSELMTQVYGTDNTDNAHPADHTEGAEQASGQAAAEPAFTEAPPEAPADDLVEVPDTFGVYFDGKTFRTENPLLTRGEWIKLLCDAFGLEGTATEGASFTDIPADHPLFVYAQACLAWGILTSDTLSPDEGATLAFAMDTGVAAMGENLSAYEGSREEKALRFARQENIVPEDSGGSEPLYYAEAEWILSCLTHRFLHAEREPFYRVEFQKEVGDFREDEGFSLNKDGRYFYRGDWALETGRVYILPGNDEHPEGLAIKITSITKNNDGSVLVSWEKPEYYEVFSEAEVLNRVVPRIEDMELAEGVSLVEYIPGSYDRAQGETNDFIKTDKTYSDHVEYPTWVFEVKLSKGDVKPKISVEYDDVKGSLDLSGLVSLVPGKEDAKAICDEAVKAYNRDEISIEEMASRIEEAQKGKHEAMPAPQKYKSDSGCKGKIKVTLSEMYFDYYAYIKTGFLGLFPELDNFTCTLNKKINVDIDFQGYFSEEIKLFSINLTGTHLARVELDVYLVFEANGDLELKYAVSKCSRIDYDKGNWRKAAEKDANGRLNLALSTSAEAKPCVKLVLDAFGLYEKDLLDVGFSIKAEFKGEIGIEQESQWYETPKGRQCDVTTVLNSSVKLTVPIIELYVNLNVLGIKVNTSLDLVSRDDAFVITALENKTVLAQTSYLVSDEVLSKSPSETRTVYVEGLKGKRSGAPIRDDSILFYDYYDYDGDGEKELLLVRSASEGTQITLVLWDGDQYQMTLDTDESLLNAYGPSFPAVSIYDIQGDKAVLRSEAILPHRSVDTFVRYETESGVKLAAASLKERSGVAEKYWSSLFLLEFKPDVSISSHILFSHSGENGNDCFVSELSGKTPEKIDSKGGLDLISGFSDLTGQNYRFKELCWIFAAIRWGLIDQSGSLLSPYSHDDLFRAERIDLRFAQDAERTPNHLAQLTEGDIIEFGSYDQDGVPGEEPIEWIVLEKREDKVLVISRYCFETSVFGESGSNWEDSRARNWLNGSFVEGAFSREERALIQETLVNLPNNAKTLQEGSDSTRDYVFLLSIQEVDYYMTPEMVTTSATENAISHGAYVEDGEVFWWLRSVGESASYAAHTRTGGVVDYEGENARKRGTLRPAMWLSTYLEDEERSGRNNSAVLSPEAKNLYLEALRNSAGNPYDIGNIAFYDFTGDNEAEMLVEYIEEGVYLALYTIRDGHVVGFELVESDYSFYLPSVVDYLTAVNGWTGSGEANVVVTAGKQLFLLSSTVHDYSNPNGKERWNFNNFTLKEIQVQSEAYTVKLKELATISWKNGKIDKCYEGNSYDGTLISREEAIERVKAVLGKVEDGFLLGSSRYSLWTQMPFWNGIDRSMTYQEAIEFLQKAE